MARKGYKTVSFTLPDGTRKYVYAKTQEELDEKVFNLKLQMRMGVDLNDKTTVGELIKLWYEADVKGKILPNTERGIKCVLNKHLLPKVSGYVAKDVTPIQVKMWFNEFDKLNQQAARQCTRALRGAFELAEENGLVYRSPVLARFKARGKELGKREALSPSQERQLLEATKRNRSHLFVWTALATGMRRGELLGLMWDCVDLDAGIIHVRRIMAADASGEYYVDNRTKTPAGIRDLPIPLDLCAELRARRASSNSLFVFTMKDGRAFTGSGFNQFWRDNVVRKAGLDCHVTPHVLRHTYATRCFEAGMDIKEVQYLMGHESPEVTMEIYTHYCKEARLNDTFEKARAARNCTTLVPHTAVETG